MHGGPVRYRDRQDCDSASNRDHCDVHNFARTIAQHMKAEVTLLAARHIPEP